MQLDPGMDTGPILAQIPLAISPDDTGGSLTRRLADLGAVLIRANLSRIAAGELTPEPQDDTGATYAPMLKKGDGRLNFLQSAELLARQVRAYEPWPGSFFFWDDLRVVVRRAHAVPTGLLGRRGLWTRRRRAHP